MANIKFSAFTVETDPTQIDALVGYQGTTMKQIAPSNLAAYPFSIETDSLYSGFVPSGLSGNPQGNTILGIDSGNALTSGANNTLLGNDAGKSLTTTASNVIIGKNAGLAKTSGSNATIIGTSAGRDTASGSFVVLVGSEAGISNTGDSAIAIGFEAGRSNTATGTISIGYDAGYSQTSGLSNVSMGYEAGYSITTGRHNTNIGHQSGKFQTGSDNVFMGMGAGGGVSGDGSRNIGIGAGALVFLTEGSDNTVIGRRAGLTITTGSNLIAIGSDAQASSASATNEITLGNANITSLRIPGLQSGASDGDVLTFSSGTGLITLQAAGGGGASSLNGLSDVVVDNTSDNAYFINIPASRSGDSNNLSIGKDALNSLTSGDRIVAIGKGALDNLTTSENVTAVGYNAGVQAGTNLMMDSTLIGHNAGKGRSGYRNTAIGGAPMSFGIGKTGVNRNTAIGYHTLYRIDTNGVDNIAIGHEASQFLTTAEANVAIGDNAARSSTADRIIAIGYQAAYSQTSGSGNTVIGERAAYSNTTGENNTSVGDETAYSSTGSKNTSVGKGAFGGGFGHSGSDNVAIGYLANQQPSGASNYNVAIGSEALRSGGTRSNNVAIGYKAGTAVTTGGSNVVIGYQAMDANTDGDDNVAIGANALGAATSDGRTVAIGVNALKLQNQTFSPMNTAVGYAADDANVSGFGRTCIGGSSGGGATGDNITNIGYQAVTSTSSVSNEITLGNSSVTSLRCAVTSITSLSDERDKSEIKDLAYGLDLIDALQPREFVWDNRVETDKEGKEFFSSNKGKKDFGFIAQEVQALDNDTLRLVYDENPEKLELSYGKLVPVLVQAIKELKAEIELLKQ